MRVLSYNISSSLCNSIIISTVATPAAHLQCTLLAAAAASPVAVRAHTFMYMYRSCLLFWETAGTLYGHHVLNINKGNVEAVTGSPLPLVVLLLLLLLPSCYLSSWTWVAHLIPAVTASQLLPSSSGRARHRTRVGQEGLAQEDSCCYKHS